MRSTILRIFASRQSNFDAESNYKSLRRAKRNRTSTASRPYFKHPSVDYAQRRWLTSARRFCEPKFPITPPFDSRVAKLQITRVAAQTELTLGRSAFNLIESRAAGPQSIATQLLVYNNI